MKADDRFLEKPLEFWANVRLISESAKYTVRVNGEKVVKSPTLAEVRKAFAKLGLDPGRIVGQDEDMTDLGRDLLDYFKHRADVLNKHVEPMLMDKDEASYEFERLRAAIPASTPVPMNKQKGDKKGPAYYTATINMLVEHHADDLPFNCNPTSLTSVTRNGVPVRTLSRRVDGAFTAVVNPIAVWEIKEYYNTTTFGSRVADGVYETQLDGFELQELRRSEGIDIGHYLMVDGHSTWWEKGQSYLCRIIDILHMGLLDEAIFGREALHRLPELVPEWVTVARHQRAGKLAHVETQRRIVQVQPESS
jgi:hypothetical protein